MSLVCSATLKATAAAATYQVPPVQRLGILLVAIILLDE